MFSGQKKKNKSNSTILWSFVTLPQLIGGGSIVGKEWIKNWCNTPCC